MDAKEVREIARKVQAESLRQMCQDDSDGDIWVTIGNEADRLDPPAPTDPPLPDESKLPQHVALAGECRVPIDGEVFVDANDGRTIHICGSAASLGVPIMALHSGRRHILIQRPDEPPKGHVHWDREDGGGYRESEHQEWSMKLVDGAWDAIQTNKTWSGNPRWVLSPPAPAGYRHKPQAEGGGYRPWKDGEWIVGEDGNPCEANYDANGLSVLGGKAWILEPLAPAELFVPDKEGAWRLNPMTDTFYKPHPERVDIDTTPYTHHRRAIPVRHLPAIEELLKGDGDV